MKIEASNPEFESCADCVYSDDSEEVCILRGCIHAVAQVKECYVPKSPTIERTGKWKRVSADKYIPSASHVYRCSRCGDINWLISKFCPNCGAKMEVQDDS